MERGADMSVEDNESSFEEEFLNKFSYVDWETGDDDKLRFGDYVVLVHQDSYTGSETVLTGRIDVFDNGVPVFIINEDPDDIGDSGEYASILEMHLKGYEFVRTTWEEWLKEIKSNELKYSIMDG